MLGVDEMLNTGYIDEDNLFVYGCSGGGILTTYIVGNTDRFTAASANCPIVNWMSANGYVGRRQLRAYVRATVLGGPDGVESTATSATSRRLPCS